MKINFDANFGAIKKVIDKPLSTGSENSGEFRRLLADISPELKVKSQNPDNVTKIPVETQFPSVMMGRLDPKSTELFGPELTALVPDESQVSSYSSSSDLKEALTPPKIIEGRRITDSEVEKIYRLSRTEREEQVRGIMASAAKRHGVDPALGMAVALTESSFNPKAVSSDGYATKGLMQLLDSTGKLQLKRNDLNHAYKPFDPNQNVDLGVGYLRYLHELFSEDTELPNKLKTVAAENSTS